ncbi:MAG: hypothetical protein ACLFUY_04260 [Desulfobacterales bacterium]
MIINGAQAYAKENLKNEILESSLSGFIFEQEYQRKQDRTPAAKIAQDLDRFFGSIPQDTRYHIEFHTEAYLSPPVFAILEKHGVGQVLTHWIWLPSLKEQLAKADWKIFNSGRQRIVRLMPPRGTRYEDAYANYNIVTKKDINRLARKIDDLEKFLANIPVARKSVSTAKKRRSAAELVLNVIEDIRSDASVSDIKAQTGFEDKKVRNILNRLYKEGKI